MRCTQIALILVITMMASECIQADPVIYFKNKSDRIINIEPFIQGQSFGAKRVKSDDDVIYNTNELGKNTKIDGIRIKYCLSSHTPDCNQYPYELTVAGNVYEFRFPPSDAEKYYLKFTIKNDIASLVPQEGIFGGKRTSNMRWSLAGNIKEGNIKGPITAAPTDMPPVLPQQTQKP